MLHEEYSFVVTDVLLFICYIIKTFMISLIQYKTGKINETKH